MRLTFAQLEALLDDLTDRYSKGKIDIQDYVDEWDDLVEFAGWTWDEFADEVDRRWTPQKRAACPMFRC